MRFLAFLPLLAAVVFFLGCGSSGTGDATQTDVKSTIERAAKTTTDFAFEQKEAFVKHMEEKSNALDKQMEALEKQGKNVPAEAKARWEKTMATLKEQKNSLQNMLQKATDTSADQWHEFSQNATKAYKQLETGLKKAAHEFHGSDSPQQQ